MRDRDSRTSRRSRARDATFDLDAIGRRVEPRSRQSRREV